MISMIQQNIIHGQHTDSGKKTFEAPLKMMVFTWKDALRMYDFFLPLIPGQIELLFPRGFLTVVSEEKVYEIVDGWTNTGVIGIHLALA